MTSSINMGFMLEVCRNVGLRKSSNVHLDSEVSDTNPMKILNSIKSLCPRSKSDETELCVETRATFIRDEDIHHITITPEDLTKPNLIHLVQKIIDIDRERDAVGILGGMMTDLRALENLLLETRVQSVRMLGFLAMEKDRNSPAKFMAAAEGETAAVADDEKGSKIK
ncbi:hypothetical protein Vadar_016470 [Vaccinium darrowii]|uniref:Uncharacterized protein n=1 Tax=Vaccinium darrowii TaxID=229202 RepID=A0ACB7Y784_9ERIC|nr:hypothetical protein Vadar_016470 [Vaccinium darrowii]